MDAHSVRASKGFFEIKKRGSLYAEITTIGDWTRGPYRSIYTKFGPPLEGKSGFFLSF